MNSWARIIVVVKIRLRIVGSSSRWFWLAIIMSGRSQQESTSSGEEIWSMEVHGVRALLG